MAKHVHIHVHDRKSGDAERFGLKEVTREEFDRKCRNGEWEAMQDITSSGRVEVRNTSNNKRFQIYVKESSRDATNHMGEREYYTFKRWKEACRSANPSVRFEGNEEVCNALPGVGEWDGEKGVVYRQSSKDSSLELALATKEVRRLRNAGIVAHYVVLERVMNMLVGQGFGREYSQKIAEQAMDLMFSAADKARDATPNEQRQIATLREELDEARRTAESLFGNASTQFVVTQTRLLVNKLRECQSLAANMGRDV